MYRRITVVVFVSLLVLASAVFSQDVPLLPGWGGNQEMIQPMADVGNASPMIAIQPCRVVDTRNPVGPYGGPKLIAGGTRAFDLNSGPCADLPGYIGAFAMNITVVQPEANNGFITAYPTGTTRPLASNLNFNLNEIKGNWAIVPVSTAGSMDVYTNVATHIVIDLYGYFTGGNILNPWNPGRRMWLYGDTTTELFGAWNQNLTSSSASSIHGYSASAINGYSTVIATANSATGSTNALLARNASTTTGATALLARATGSTGLPNAIRGELTSTTDKANAIFGIAGPAYWVSGNGAASGVRGQASSPGYAVGVFGEGTGGGLQGYRVDAAGVMQTRGVVGSEGNDGLWTQHNMTALGTKSFVEPHPTEAGKVIKYVSLEGPEAGTYFRGRSRSNAGFAVIDVPEDFRLVTDAEGLTVQLTAIGRSAEFAVVRVDLQQIIVRANRDVEFFYHVNGVRKLFREFQPIQDNPAEAYFRPSDAGERLETQGFSPEIQARLIANGTYHPDGSVNMQTAERMGWAQEWRDRAEQQRLYEAAAAAVQTSNWQPPTP
jgi:hypothetical protein